MLRSCWKWILLALFVLFIRKTDSFLNPQFWAEDGAVFFRDQFALGSRSVFLPYAGYINLLPRLTAVFADACFSYLSAPAVYALISLMCVALVVLQIFSPRFVVPKKGLLALSVVLVPNLNNEIFVNITNVQWITCLAMIVVLLKESPESKYGNIFLQYFFDGLTLLVCGLTGPFLIFLLPCFVVRHLKIRIPYTLYLLMCASVVSVIQLTAMLPEIATHEPTSAAATEFPGYAFASIFGFKLFGNLFLGRGLALNFNVITFCVLYSLLVGVLIWCSRTESFIRISLLIQASVIGATLFKFHGSLSRLAQADASDRYFYIPYVLISWSFVILLNAERPWKRHFASCGLIAILASSLSSGFHTTVEDRDWKTYASEIGRGDLTIPINPEGWEIVLPARNTETQSPN